jgi:hypothetical protein
VGASYAVGKRSIAICDRCGCRAKYLDLKAQVVNSIRTGLRVCPDCLDQDHPQLKLNRVRIDDPQALRHARPESDKTAQRELIPPAYDPNFNVR